MDVRINFACLEGMSWLQLPMRHYANRWAQNLFRLFLGGMRAPQPLNHNTHSRERKKKVYRTHIDSESALLTAIDNTADRLQAPNSSATESTAKFDRNQTLSTALFYISVTSMSPRASSSSSTELQSRYNTASSISNRSNVIMAYLEHNHEDISEMMHDLVA